MFSSAKRRLAGSVALGLAALALPHAALATEGYFSLGYGVQQQGVAGAGVAWSQDAMSGSINPAAVASVGKELSFGMQLFSPIRSVTGKGTMFVAPGTTKSGHDYFLMPNFAYNLPLANGGVLNVSAYGNGGMNTSYPAVANANCGGGTGVFCAGKAGVNLEQLFVSVGYAKKEGNFSWGVAPTLAVQAFSARGLAAFSTMSVNPAKLTNNGTDISTGFGLRAGFQYEVTPQVAFGLSGQTKFHMSKLKDYAGLFENGGSFDIPAAITAGVAFHPRSDLTLLLDYERIFYSDVPAVADPMTSGALGAKGGAGFGWDDVDVIRIAAEWQQTPDMTWRVGFAHATNPVGTDDVTFNILAPGIVQDHFSFGGTKKLNDRDRLDFAFSYVKKNTVSGPEMTSMGPTGGTVKLKMHQVSASIGWTRRF
ncbi:MAG: OmpP1/FadL family transporter [Paenirhodobacter sp.]|uniref:OmpP1/FadL family transporter n=1 Tax=Paenirhodobacter sp. TaxID=1965326 RepID=UPI003D0D74CD